MKSAEQWVAEAKLIVNGTSRAEHLKLVKAIQEDAWRDGMGCGMRWRIALQHEYDKRFGVKKEP